MESEIFIAGLGLLITLGGIIWGFSLWLNRSFSEVKELIYVKLEAMEKNILDKLEYHERHDDIRFNEVHKDIWELKLSNAATVAHAKRIIDKDKN